MYTWFETLYVAMSTLIWLKHLLSLAYIITLKLSFFAWKYNLYGPFNIVPWSYKMPLRQLKLSQPSFSLQVANLCKQPKFHNSFHAKPLVHHLHKVNIPPNSSTQNFTWQRENHTLLITQTRFHCLQTQM